MDEKRVVVEDSVLIGVKIKGGHISFQQPIALVKGCTFIDCTMDWGSCAGGDCSTCYWGSRFGEGRYGCMCSFKSDHPPVTGCYQWQQRGE